MLHYGIVQGWHCIVINQHKGTELQRFIAEANGMLLKHMLIGRGVSKDKIYVVYE